MRYIQYARHNKRGLRGLIQQNRPEADVAIYGLGLVNIEVVTNYDIASINTANLIEHSFFWIRR